MVNNNNQTVDFNNGDDIERTFVSNWSRYKFISKALAYDLDINGFC
jgi:hypothetical protein